MEEPVVRPGDLALEELRRIGGSVVDAIAEYHAGLDDRPVLPCVSGRVALRMSICSHRTLERDVETTFEALAGLGRRLAADAGLGEAGGDSTPLVANP
jgi:hypothetical protein